MPLYRMQRSVTGNLFFHILVVGAIDGQNELLNRAQLGLHRIFPTRQSPVKPPRCIVPSLYRCTWWCNISIDTHPHLPVPKSIPLSQFLRLDSIPAPTFPFTKGRGSKWRYGQTLYKQRPHVAPLPDLSPTSSLPRHDACINHRPFSFASFPSFLLSFPRGRQTPDLLPFLPFPVVIVPFTVPAPPCDTLPLLLRLPPTPPSPPFRPNMVFLHLCPPLPNQLSSLSAPPEHMSLAPFPVFSAVPPHSCLPPSTPIPHICAAVPPFRPSLSLSLSIHLPLRILTTNYSSTVDRLPIPPPLLYYSTTHPSASTHIQPHPPPHPCHHSSIQHRLLT